MTTLKPGDRVTSTLLVGEWEVTDGRCEADTIRVTQGSARSYVPLSTLTLIAPPLPPEPPVGSVVFCPNVADPADGKWYAMLRFDDYSKPWSDAWGNTADWAEIAADARPAVPKPTVDEMAEALTPWSNVDGLTTTERARIIMHDLGWEVPK